MKETSAVREPPAAAILERKVTPKGFRYRLPMAARKFITKQTNARSRKGFVSSSATDRPTNHKTLLLKIPTVFPVPTLLITPRQSLIKREVVPRPASAKVETLRKLSVLLSLTVPRLLMASYGLVILNVLLPLLIRHPRQRWQVVKRQVICPNLILRCPIEVPLVTTPLRPGTIQIGNPSVLLK